jgi:hypothetical protein
LIDRDVSGQNSDDDEVIITEIESLQSLLDQTIKYQTINLNNDQKNRCYVIILLIGGICIDVYIPDSIDYPSNIPIVLMRKNNPRYDDNLLLFIQLKLYEKLLELKNDCMMYEIVSFLRDNIEKYLGLSNISKMMISNELSSLINKNTDLSIESSTYVSTTRTDPVLNVDNSSGDEMRNDFRSNVLANNNDDDNSDYYDNTTQESSSNNITLSDIHNKDQNNSIVKNQNYMTDDDTMSVLTSTSNSNVKKDKKFNRKSFWSRLPDNYKTTNEKHTDLYLKMLKERKNLPAWGSR